MISVSEIFLGIFCGIVSSIIATYIVRFIDKKKHKNNRYG